MKIIVKILLVLAVIGLIASTLPMLGAGKGKPNKTEFCMCGLAHDHSPAVDSTERTKTKLNYARNATWATLGLFALGALITSKTPVPHYDIYQTSRISPLLIAGLFGSAGAGINLMKKEYAAENQDNTSWPRKVFATAVGTVATLGSLIFWALNS